jgi:hypothetical protein
MPIDPLGRVRRGWRSVTDAHSKVEKRQSGMAKGGAQVGSGGRAAISRSLAIQLKQEIANLDLDDPSDQVRAVERFVSVVLVEELGLKDQNGADFHELVDRVAKALSEGGARPDVLRALATLI